MRKGFNRTNKQTQHEVMSSLPPQACICQLFFPFFLMFFKNLIAVLVAASYMNVNSKLKQTMLIKFSHYVSKKVCCRINTHAYTFTCPLNTTRTRELLDTSNSHHCIYYQAPAHYLNEGTQRTMTGRICPARLN
jgi:hypothetical protein